MYIITKSRPTKLPISLCKQAVKFYGRYLLGENMYHKITVNLVFEKFKKGCNDYAYCLWEDNNVRGKEFTITIDKTLSKKAMLFALAHEMVHVKQYAKGELSDYLKVNKCKWFGTRYDLDKVDYWEYPWEIEAHGRERGLYVKFMSYGKDYTEWQERTSKQK
jgi:hypothetical protein